MARRDCDLAEGGKFKSGAGGPRRGENGWGGKGFRRVGWEGRREGGGEKRGEEKEEGRLLWHLHGLIFVDRSY